MLLSDSVKTVELVEHTPPSEDELRRRVERELGRRLISARQAAVDGEVSNTAWSTWMAGKTPLGNAMKAAVARAFDWPSDWWLYPPAEPVGGPDDPTLRALDEKLDAILEILERMAAQNASLAELLGSGSRRPSRR